MHEIRYASLAPKWSMRGDWTKPPSMNRTKEPTCAHIETSRFNTYRSYTAHYATAHRSYEPTTMTLAARQKRLPRTHTNATSQSQPKLREGDGKNKYIILSSYGLPSSGDPFATLKCWLPALIVNLYDYRQFYFRVLFIRAIVILFPERWNSNDVIHVHN